MGIWRQMLCVTGSGKTHERLKRCCRKEQRSTLKSECSTANTVAVTRRCFNLMMNSQFVLLQLWKGERKTLGHGNGDVGDQVIWSNPLPTFLCWRTLSRTGKTKLKFLCKMWTPHRNSNSHSCIQLRISWGLDGELGPHGFLSCKVMSKVLHMGAGHTGHVLPKTIAPDTEVWRLGIRRATASKCSLQNSYQFILYVYYYGRVKLTASAYTRSCGGLPKFTKT